MTITGCLSKMQVSLTHPITYTLPIGAEGVSLNPLLGKQIRLQFSGAIYCCACQKKIKKSYQQGYCFPCTQKLAACDFCILKPELCHYHLGTCREPDWGLAHCMQPHVVYFANTSGLKVGITRARQLPIRWIDQGASSAVPLYTVQSRRIAGLLEVAYAKCFQDKTNWRTMLKGLVPHVELKKEAQAARHYFNNEMNTLLATFGKEAVIPLPEAEVVQLIYPVLAYPEKVHALSFEKKSLIEGKLMGIKGQYLLFDSGVLNIRKHTGYEIQFDILNPV